MKKSLFSLVLSFYMASIALVGSATPATIERFNLAFYLPQGVEVDVNEGDEFRVHIDSIQIIIQQRDIQITQEEAMNNIRDISVDFGFDAIQEPFKFESNYIDGAGLFAQSEKDNYYGLLALLKNSITNKTICVCVYYPQSKKQEAIDIMDSLKAYKLLPLNQNVKFGNSGITISLPEGADVKDSSDNGIEVDYDNKFNLNIKISDTDIPTDAQLQDFSTYSTENQPYAIQMNDYSGYALYFEVSDGILKNVIHGKTYDNGLKLISEATYVEDYSYIVDKIIESLSFGKKTDVMPGE